jgi:Serine hydrolase (FSH1)
MTFCFVMDRQMAHALDDMIVHFAVWAGDERLKAKCVVALKLRLAGLLHVPGWASFRSCIQGVGASSLARDHGRPAAAGFHKDNIPPPSEMRILCLHGYCQNARVFAAKTAALRKSLARDARAELVYVDAPFVVADGTGHSEDAPAEQRGGVEPANLKRTWWNASKDGAVYGGWQDTMQYLTTIFRQQVRSCCSFYHLQLVTSANRLLSVLYFLVSARDPPPPTHVLKPPSCPPPLAIYTFMFSPSNLCRVRSQVCWDFRRARCSRT